MIRELSAALLSRGLRWKPSSLEVMFTDYNQHNPVYAHDEDGEYTFEVVNELKALGALLCKEGTSPRAVVHRLAAATKAFWANANVLLDKSLSLPARFREFTVRVQSVALYSAECWPMCQATLQRLAAWESGLLRRIVGIKKKPSETWVGYHKRAARTSRSLFMRYAGKPCYVIALERYHKAAANVKNMNDSKYVHSLFGHAATWRGTHYWKTMQGVAAGQTTAEVWRHQVNFNGRKTRWDHLLYEVYAESWVTRASSSDWHASQAEFTSKALRLCGMDLPGLSRSNRKKGYLYSKGLIAKSARCLEYDATLVPWMRHTAEEGDKQIMVEVLSDSQLAVNWLLGVGKVGDTYRQRVAAVQNRMQSAWTNRSVLPRLPWADVFRHIYRELNVFADEAAKKALDERADFCIHHAAFARMNASIPKYVRIFTDGSHKNGLAAAGYVVFVAWDAQVPSATDIPEHWTRFCGTLDGPSVLSNLVTPCWELALTMGRYLGQSTIVNAELRGLEDASSFIESLVNG
jgi:ribonuclease HI